MDSYSPIQHQMQPDVVSGTMSRLVPIDVQAAFATSLAKLSEEFCVLIKVLFGFGIVNVFCFKFKIVCIYIATFEYDTIRLPAYRCACKLLHLQQRSLRVFKF